MMTLILRLAKALICSLSSMAPRPMAPQTSKLRFEGCGSIEHASMYVHVFENRKRDTHVFPNVEVSSRSEFSSHQSEMYETPILGHDCASRQLLHHLEGRKQKNQAIPLNRGANAT